MSFPTSWNDFTTSTEYGPRPRPLEQRGGDVYLLAHHAVNRVVQDTIALSKPGGRRVSETFAIGPTTAGVEAPVYCVGVVPESARPFTTASELDAAAFTVEVSNIDLTADYPVAAAAKEWLAQIAAYMHRTFQMPLDRAHVLSHQEVYRLGLGSYPTACPGPDLQRSLDDIVSRAIELVKPPIDPEEGTMYKYIWNGVAAPNAGARYALIGVDFEAGYVESSKLADAQAYSGMSPMPGAPHILSNAAFDATLALARRARADYLASRAEVTVGSLKLDSATIAALAKANAEAFFVEQKKAGN